MELPSSSSDNSVDGHNDVSVGPTTPAGSPMFDGSRSDSALETRYTSLSDLMLLDEAAPQSMRRPHRLPDIRDSATAIGISTKKICFIGAGYVGVPTAAVLALKNPSVHVTVVDRDARRIRRWNSSHLPISEPGLLEIVRATRDGYTLPAECGGEGLGLDGRSQVRRSNLRFTTDTASNIAMADIIFICVNTGTKMSGVGAGAATDMTAFESVVREIAANAKPTAIIVEKSTVPCRTARMVDDVLTSLNPRSSIEILSNPEFLAEGTAVHNLLNPDRIIIGSAHTISGHRAAAALARLYTSFVPSSRVLGTHVWSSELAKLVANAMLAQRISSINSISTICEKTGADIHEVAKAVGMDSRIGSQFLKAGLGYGGSCFRKDIASLVYLARSLGLDDVAEYWDAVTQINVKQRKRFTRMVVQHLNGTLIGKKVAILGFAFKKNTGDCRESLAVDVISQLLEERPGEIAIFDPVCLPEDIQREIDALRPHHGATMIERVKIYTDPYQACVSASATLIVTDWDFFRNTPAKRKDSTPSTLSLFPTPSLSSSPSSTSPLSSRTPLTVAATSLSMPQFEFPYSSPTCPSDCPDCALLSTRPDYGSFSSEERIEWARISYHLKRPKIVFDGRDVVDKAEMEALGIRVVGLGKGDDSGQQSRGIGGFAGGFGGMAW